MLSLANDAACPCGSNLSYGICCGPYHTYTSYAPSAEALMRSRYSAYTLANIPYIQATMQGIVSQGYDAKEAERWASQARWKRLKVLRAYADENDINCAYVEFIAYYILNGQHQQLHELSVFHYINDKWFYVDHVTSIRK